jgi:hypothetical protein
LEGGTKNIKQNENPKPHDFIIVAIGTNHCVVIMVWNFESEILSTGTKQEGFGMFYIYIYIYIYILKKDLFIYFIYVSIL